MNLNLWSLQYCRDVFGMTGYAADTWEKSKIRFFRSKRDTDVGFSAEVTRKIGSRHCLNIDPISFVVESTLNDCANSRHFFIKFNEDHGVSIINVLQVIQPQAMETGINYELTMRISADFFYARRITIHG